MDLENQLAQVNSRKELGEFVSALLADFLNNPSAWENPDLESFLEAMATWLDFDDESIKPTWRYFGEILMAARIYE